MTLDCDFKGPPWLAVDGILNVNKEIIRNTGICINVKLNTGESGCDDCSCGSAVVFGATNVRTCIDVTVLHGCDNQVCDNEQALLCDDYKEWYTIFVKKRRKVPTCKAHGV